MRKYNKNEQGIIPCSFLYIGYWLSLNVGQLKAVTLALILLF